MTCPDTVNDPPNDNSTDTSTALTAEDKGRLVEGVEVGFFVGAGREIWDVTWFELVCVSFACAANNKRVELTHSRVRLVMAP